MIKWLYWHFPIITTRCRFDKECGSINKNVEKTITKQYMSVINAKDKEMMLIVKKTINSLMELRNNTWDKDRVDNIIKFLLDNFEVNK